MTDKLKNKLNKFVKSKKIKKKLLKDLKKAKEYVSKFKDARNIDYDI
jgi:hypothetical protein